MSAVPADEEVLSDMKDDGTFTPEPELASHVLESMPPLLKLDDLLKDHGDDVKELLKRMNANPEYVEEMKIEDNELIALRFVRGYGDVEKAWAAFEKSIQLRIKWKAHEFLDEVWERRQFRFLDKIYPASGGCLTVPQIKDGRAFSMRLLGRLKVDELLKNVTLEEYSQYTIELLVTNVRALNRVSRSRGVLMANFIILDLKGIGLSILKFRSWFSAEVELGQATAPECSASICILNAPSFFHTTWGIVKPMLHERTIQKIRIYGSDGKGEEFIRSQFDLDYCPVMFGGKNFTVADQWMESFDTPFKTENVAAGKTVEVTSDVYAVGCEVTWKAKPKARDIGITVKFVGADKSEKVLQESTKTSTQVEGSFKSETTGKIVFTFDNSYSYMMSKSCLYYVGVKTSKPMTFK